MSLCDRCQRPGACCTFKGNDGTWPAGGKDMTIEQVRQAIKDNPQYDIHGNIVSLQIEPLWKNPQGQWTFWCKALVAGRCSIYERRPVLCRNMQPGPPEPLCWHTDTTIPFTPENRREKGQIINLARGLPFNQSFERGKDTLGSHEAKPKDGSAS